MIHDGGLGPKIYNGGKETSISEEMFKKWKSDIKQIMYGLEKKNLKKSQLYKSLKSSYKQFDDYL
jgi:hypothetical protein